MPLDAAHYNRIADTDVDQAVRTKALLDDVLDPEWASQGYTDEEIAGRHAARVSVAEKVAGLYRHAAESRAKAFDQVAPKAETETKLAW